MSPDTPVPILLAPDLLISGESGTTGQPSAAELLGKILEESALALESGTAGEIPADELHQEILVPLLPAMLRDRSIQHHWRTQTATGFVTRLATTLQAVNDTANTSSNPPHPACPLWQPADFEIHVAASYQAGSDAKALADTLLSEEALRELASTLMNQILVSRWPSLCPTPLPVEGIPAPEPAASTEVVVSVALPVPSGISKAQAPAVSSTKFQRAKIKSCHAIGIELLRRRTGRLASPLERLVLPHFSALLSMLSH